MRYWFAKLIDKKGAVVGLVSDIKVYEDGSYRFADITIDGAYVEDYSVTLTLYINPELYFPFNIKDYHYDLSPTGALTIVGNIYEKEYRYD